MHVYCTSFIVYLILIKRYPLKIISVQYSFNDSNVNCLIQNIDLVRENVQGYNFSNQAIDYNTNNI